MFEYYKGNTDVIARLCNWVRMKSGTGLLLQGQKGLGLKTLAINTAQKVLCINGMEDDCSCKSCRYQTLSHPDFLLVEPLEGENKMGVERASEILSKATLVPAVSKHIVVVVDGIDLMTIQAQNKLLKLLEDNDKVILIGILYSDRVLDTIKSRMLLLKFNPLTEAEFDTFESGEDNFIMYQASKGCPGAVKSLQPIMETLKRILAAIGQKELRDFIPILHLLKEKDTESFYTKNKSELGYLLNLMEAGFMDVLRFLTLGENGRLVQPEVVYDEEEVTDRLELINQEKNNITVISYTKDDFFSFIIKLI